LEEREKEERERDEREGRKETEERQFSNKYANATQNAYTYT
jgi:hypothetical protein